MCSPGNLYFPIMTPRRGTGELLMERRDWKLLRIDIISNDKILKIKSKDRQALNRPICSGKREATESQASNRRKLKQQQELGLYAVI